MTSEVRQQGVTNTIYQRYGPRDLPGSFGLGGLDVGQDWCKSAIGAA
jgi:hypothetical protein